MTRKAWLDPDRPESRPGSVKATTLADVAKPESRPQKAKQCRICLADNPGKNGVCEDRQACEERQPPLIIPLDEI